MVGPVAALADDAFQAIAGGMAKEFRAAADLMVAVAQRAGGIGPDQPGQPRLAVFERGPGQVVAVEMEQVERVEHQGIGALVGDRILQMAEIGGAIRFEMDELTVDQRRGDRQFAELGGQCGKFRGPVEAVAGQQPHRAVADPADQPVAVIFDLVKPLRPVRRLVGRARQLHPGIGRQPRFFGAGDARGPGRRRRFGGGALLAVRPPDAVAVGGDLFEPAAGGDAARLVGDDPIAALRQRRRVALLDQQPVLAVAAAMLAGHLHQCPSAMQFLAVEREFEIALGIGGFRVGIERGPDAAIPDQRGAGAVLPARNDALEPAIFERVVFDMNRQALLARIEARPFRHRPALQHPVEFEPEIVMQPARRMLLDDKGQGPSRALRRRRAGRLGGFREIAFASVFAERHCRRSPAADVIR